MTVASMLVLRVSCGVAGVIWVVWSGGSFRLGSGLGWGKGRWGWIIGRWRVGMSGRALQGDIGCGVFGTALLGLRSR
ncbi:unnamed protein product [Penicillium salamii]|uniref:Uncharacterized protein n=1 Tax=Penicillium salamii TaxID=1612424 RepID=A0A9W4NMG9_9EURO|nr:unnamed protein product [Penicillium salamii]CAG8368557.1 unnamed protein product [Penicillium salamii]CAG8384117.1 unnamed protein product [Penicillium salamii]